MHKRLIGFVIGSFATFGIVLLSGPAIAKVDCNAARCAVQSTIDSKCPCGGAKNAGRYVMCVTQAVNQLVASGRLPKTCLSAAKRCLGTSSCGRKANVVCRTNLACTIKPSANFCIAKGGTPSFGSCCASCP
ncbi:MAG TPA: hypothetical protein VL403_00920 [Candidatus Kryptonia bacterium]|nr:hypothetical protein [Candidatus Kryptonia bacterium]